MNAAKTLMAGSIALIIIATLALMVGAIPLSMGELLCQITHPSSNSEGFILFEIRLPRVLATLAVGALLALSGHILQAIMRNDLAEPALLGISSGAAVSTGFSLLCLSYFTTSIQPDWINGIMSTTAFLGALFTTFIVQRMASINGQIGTQQLVLTGVAINALCGAALGLISYLSTDDQLRNLAFWTLGGMGGITWSKFLAITMALVALIVYSTKHAKHLDLITFGDQEAQLLGVNTSRIKNRTIILSSLAVGISVAFCGIISFIGLITPHVSRLISGSKHQHSILTSMFLGALLLTTADMISRTIIRPAELPIGILTSLLGAPFFIALLRKSQKINRHV